MIERHIRSWLAGFVVAALWPGLAFAQQDRDEESRQRFRHAVELVDEGDLPAALAELEQSYRLRPVYQTLYNVGTVSAALGRAVEAVDALGRYLRDGGAAIAAPRRAEVEAEIARLRRRIARVWVRCAVDGAELAIDDVPRGTTPLAAALRVTEGQRRLTVRAAGYQSSTQVVQLAGDVERTIEVVLQRAEQARGTVRLTTRPGGVEIRIDGQPSGRTPLGRTLALAPGSHRIEATRAGYRASRSTLVVREREETEVALVLQRDPDAPAEALGRLAVRLPPARGILRVDGRRTEPESELPIGEHTVRVEVDGRVPLRGRVQVRAGRTTVWAPALRWQGATRLGLIESASSRRLAAWVTTLSGLAVGVTGAAIGIWNETRLDEFDDLAARMAIACADRSSAQCAMFESDLTSISEIRRQNDTADSVAVVRWGAAVPMVVAGGAALGIGLVLLATTPSERAIDRSAGASLRPSLRLRVGLLDLQLAGTF